MAIAPSSASVITLPPAHHAKTFRLFALNKILARQLEGGFIGFRAARAKINAASVAHAFRRQRKKPRSKFLCRGGMKLRAVRES